MARKQDNFDPLGGFVSGPAKPNKKSKRVNDLLGSNRDIGSSSIYDEADYSMPSGKTDALTATGEAVPEKKKKHGFFFGRKEKPVKVQEVPKDPGFDSSEYKIEIKGGLVDTGIAERYADEEPEYSHEHAEKSHAENIPEPVEEDDFFEDVYEESEHQEPAPSPIHTEQIHHIPKPIQHDIKVSDDDIQNPLVQKKESVPHHPNVCFLCGEASPDALPQFGFGDGSNPDDFAPLCKTCLHAVTTLMKFREPSDESEIKAEWRSLCPGLDDSRANTIITEGRKHH